MKFFTCFALLYILLFSSCNQALKKESNQEPMLIVSDSLSPNQKWMDAINTKDINILENLYTENPYVLSINGVDISNRDSLLNAVSTSNFKVTDVKTINRIKANEDYDYEIGSFKNKDGVEVKSIIIWKRTDSIDLRELEFLAETSNSSVDFKIIDSQRTEWMRLCNKHNASNLIEAMYTKNTMYYNRGRLLHGRVALIQEYDYMNDPQYQLTLQPITIESISESLIYELGQCSGSYNGKYILVWQKNQEGVWQIMFDSNI